LPGVPCLDSSMTDARLKEEVVQVVAKTNGGQHRYPAAWFYHVDATSKTPIPDTETLTWPPPVGIVLEILFWLDIVKTGIASMTEPPEFHSQNASPILLRSKSQYGQKTSNSQPKKARSHCSRPAQLSPPSFQSRNSLRPHLRWNCWCFCSTKGLLLLPFE
jgi:hypothetical protein